MTSVMKQIKIEKVTLNCGCGTDHDRLEKSVKLLEQITKRKVVKTKTQLRVAQWSLRKGLPIGTKVTVRSNDAIELAKRLLVAKDNKLGKNNFDTNGNVSFGINECIDIPGVEYDPKIGIIGLQVCITLARPGNRVKSRMYKPAKLGTAQKITQDDAIAYMQETFGVELLQEEIEEE
ncbi:MAG: 50S ribosomal protein L5 [Candidatus Woesearchaeota archaeon]